MSNLIDPNTAAVSGIYSEQIMSMHDVFKPQHIPVLFQRFGSQYMPLFQFFRSLGRETPIANDEWFAHEENWYHRTIKLTGATAAAANPGDPVQVTLAPEEHDSKGNSYPRVGDVISLPNSNFDQVRIEAKDTSNKTAHVLTLKPANSSVTIPAFPDGTVLAITNGAFGAGTGQPKGTVLGTTQRHFVAQIFKETIGAEGSQLVNEKWYKVMEDGKSVKGYYSPGYLRGDYLMALKIDGAFMWGDESDNLVVPDGEKGAGNAVKMTKGIFRHVRELGKTLQYTEGSWAPTDLDTVKLYLLSQGINSGYAMFLVGAILANDIENGMVDYLGAKSTPDYTHAVKQVFGGNEDLAVSIGFSIIKKGGIKFLIKPMDAWSNPMTFGANGYDLAKYGLIFPLSKFTDPKTRKLTNNIETRYRAMDGYSRRFETWTIGGAGKGLKLSEIDETNTYFRAHIGLQAMKVNQMAIVEP